MDNRDHMKIIYMQFALIGVLICALCLPDITCSFDWPDVGIAGGLE